MENKLELFEVEEFNSYSEYEKFDEYIKYLIAEDIILVYQKVIPKRIYPNEYILEKWFVDNYDNIWVFIEPDFPFKGFFKKLKNIENNNN